MDAYVFATGATQQAVSSLLSAVGTYARVVLPLSGDRALYVAVEGDTQGELDDNVELVTDTSGLTGVTVYTAAGSTTHPTFASVDSELGLALLDVIQPTAAAAATAAAAVTGVIGVAIVSSAAQLLVEATAATTGAVNGILDDVDALASLSVVFTATGPTANGAGFPV